MTVFPSSIKGLGKFVLIALAVWVVLSGFISGGALTAIGRVLFEAAQQ